MQIAQSKVKTAMPIDVHIPVALRFPSIIVIEFTTVCLWLTLQLYIYNCITLHLLLPPQLPPSTAAGENGFVARNTTG